jgi:hypothetical protein
MTMWLRAYFAAGGDFRHVESIKKLRRVVVPSVQHFRDPDGRERRGAVRA